MSRKILHLAGADRKPPPPDGPTSEPMPTRVEHAELTTSVYDFNLTMETDLVRVTVAAEKLSRALALGIYGYEDAIAREVSEPEDLDVLQELASGVKMLCDQAKRLVATGPGAEPAFLSKTPKGGGR